METEKKQNQPTDEKAIAFHRHVIERFQAVLNERDVYFHYDHEDGFFIKVSEGGSSPRDNYYIGDIDVEAKRENIIEAMAACCDFVEKKDREYQEHLSRSRGSGI